MYLRRESRDPSQGAGQASRGQQQCDADLVSEDAAHNHDHDDLPKLIAHLEALDDSANHDGGGQLPAQVDVASTEVPSPPPVCAAETAEEQIVRKREADSTLLAALEEVLAAHGYKFGHSSPVFGPGSGGYDAALASLRAAAARNSQ